MSRTIVVEAVYPHSPERVWAALTDSRALAAWLMENDFQPRIGHRFTFRMKPQPGFDGIVRCEVKELVAPRKLAFTWVGGPLDSRVTFALSPEGGGTRLRLEHVGFDSLKAKLLSLIMRGGWGKMLRRKIPAVIERMGPDGTIGDAAAPDCAGQCDSSWGKRAFARFLSLVPGGK